ncbi:transposase [Oligoflexus tunisiensis]|uniref:transposase n=1 Tax=Oligoflexus tunisiensis TaxID=708132 RepID=UPI00114D0EA2|nr:transposase [Oligoflexus tunisiensis]
MSKTEVVGGIERRRKFTDEQKAMLVAEVANTSLSEVSRKHGIAMSVLSTWKKKFPPRSFSLVEVSEPEAKPIDSVRSSKSVEPLPPPHQAIRVIVRNTIVVEFPLTAEPDAIAEFVKALEG